MLTTSQAEEDILRSYKLHANAYVTKPVDFEHFIAAIRQIDDFFLTLVCCPSDRPRGPGGGSERQEFGTRREIRMYDATLAETVTIRGARRRRDRGLPGPAAEPGTVRRRGGDPSHARLRRADQGNRPHVRGRRLQRADAEPLPPGGARAPARTTPPRRPGPRAASPTTGWSATWPGRPLTCAA